MLSFLDQTHRKRFSCSEEFPLRVGLAIESKSRIGGSPGFRCQDSIAVEVSGNCLIGTVCDGCGGFETPGSNQDDNSANEVGAILLSEMVIQGIINENQKSPIEKMSSDQVDKAVSRIISQALKQFRKLIPKSKSNATSFVDRFLNTTIQILIATESRALVYGCGDGVIEFNGKVTTYEAEEGHYICAHLAEDSRTERSLHRRFESPLDKLSTLMIATDGWQALAEDREIPSLISILGPNEDNKNGYDEQFIRRLRSGLENAANPRSRLRDDVAILFVERIPQTKTIEKESCPMP